MFRRCKHNWIVLDKTVLPSAYEQVIKAQPDYRHTQAIPLMSFRKKVIIIMVCETCGKMKTITRESTMW